MTLIDPDALRAALERTASEACTEVGLSPRWTEDLTPVLSNALAPLLADAEQAADRRGYERGYKDGTRDAYHAVYPHLRESGGTT